MRNKIKMKKIALVLKLLQIKTTKQKIMKILPLKKALIMRTILLIIYIIYLMKKLIMIL